MTTISIPSGRVRCPWFGVNVAGARPLVLSTERVEAALKGVTVTDAAVVEAKRQASGEGWQRRQGEPTRAVEVTYTHGRGHGRAVFYDLGACDLSICCWAERQRERLAKKPAAMSARERRAGVVVRRLEKEKRQLYVHRPVHPLLQREGYEYAAPESCRASEWRWRQEKPMRRQLAHIAGMALKHKVTNATAYRMLLDAGFTVTKFSELRKWDRDRAHDVQSEYWRHIHFFAAGMLAGPSREGRESHPWTGSRSTARRWSRTWPTGGKPKPSTRRSVPCGNWRHFRRFISWMHGRLP